MGVKKCPSEDVKLDHIPPRTYINSASCAKMLPIPLNSYFFGYLPIANLVIPISTTTRDFGPKTAKYFFL